MKKTVTLQIETNGKNLDQASEQAVMDAVTKALEATAFSVTVKVQQDPAPAQAAPAAPAPAPKAA